MPCQPLTWSYGRSVSLVMWLTQTLKQVKHNVSLLVSCVRAPRRALCVSPWRLRTAFTWLSPSAHSPSWMTMSARFSVPLPSGPFQQSPLVITRLASAKLGVPFTNTFPFSLTSIQNVGSVPCLLSETMSRHSCKPVYLTFSDKQTFSRALCVNFIHYSASSTSSCFILHKNTAISLTIMNSSCAFCEQNCPLPIRWSRHLGWEAAGNRQDK